MRIRFTFAATTIGLLLASGAAWGQAQKGHDHDHGDGPSKKSDDHGHSHGGDAKRDDRGPSQGQAKLQASAPYRGPLPAHHGSRFGYKDWTYVVPHHPKYAGAYFIRGQSHFYTPSPLVPLVGVESSAIAVQNPVELKFGGFARYDDLAGRLALQTNAMCLDMHYNYRQNQDFAKIYSEAYRIAQMAKRVHAKEDRGDREAVRRTLVQMDQFCHHVESEMRGWVRGPGRQIGGDYLPDKVAAVEAILHHLCYDVGVKPHGEEAVPASPPIRNQAAPPPAGNQ